MEPDERAASVVRIADEALRGGFTQIPNAVLSRTDVSAGAKLTYVVLLSYAWQEGSCFPGQARLARDVGESERSVRNRLNELRAAGLLSVERRGQGMTNVYTLESLVEPNLTGTTFRSGPERGAAPDRNHVPPTKTQRKKTNMSHGSKPRHPDWALATDTPDTWVQTYRRE